jgi:mannose-6-phosphate isomerase-like protein (cupin superfamily)
MDQQIRRVVTTHDGTGKAVVLFDGIATNRTARKQTGTTSSLLWVTDSAPARFSGRRDCADVKIGVAPSPNGTIFRVVDFPPVTDDVSRIDHQQLLRDMGLSHGTEAGSPPRHPFMHRTRSVDYAVVLAGEIDMLLDDSDVHLKAGDVVVQQGTNHAWVNRGTAPCRIAFVLVDAE